MVRTSNVRSTGCEFNSRLCAAQVILGWVTVCEWVKHPGMLPIAEVNLAFHPSEVGKSSTGLSGWDYGRVCSLGLQVILCDPIWQVSSRNKLWGGVSLRALPFLTNLNIVLVISELSVEWSLDISDLCPFVMSHCLCDIQLCTLNVYKYVLHM